MYKTLSVQEFKSDLILNSAKIVIIVLFSLVVISNFVPFFEATHDSYVYALKAISLTEGTWEVGNEKLLETGEWEFVPNSWKKTIHNTAIPKYPPGIPAIGSIAYFVSGIGGLFFLGPFFAILLLIISDRVATNLFGKEVGLLTILFLASNGIIYSGGIHLLSDNIFTALVVLAFFCLIKFFQDKKFSYLVISSLLLSISSFIRVSGIIYFPIEIGIIIIFLLYTRIKIKNKINENLLQTKINITKISLAVILPWLVFILFFMGFNVHYFGASSITFYNVPGDPWVRPGTGSYLSIIEPSSENFEIIKSYSNFVLPYPLYKIEVLDFEKILLERDDPLTTSLVNSTVGFIGKNMLGLVTILVLFFAIFISFFKINKKMIILIFSLLIFSNIIFWSAGHISFGRDSVLGRYMVPAFPFFSIIISFLIINFLKMKQPQNKTGKRITIKFLKIVVLVILTIFFGISWYVSPIGQEMNLGENSFSDPEFFKYYPLNLEGLNQNSIIVGGHSAKIIDYGFTTFDPFVGVPIQRNLPLDPADLNPATMEKLREIVGENDVFVFKESVSKHERIFRSYLIDSQGYVLKEFSKTFCKLELSEEDQNKIDKSDMICLE